MHNVVNELKLNAELLSLDPVCKWKARQHPLVNDRARLITRHGDAS